ncbi:GNAT family N-acetyltransferase [Synechococcus sp. BSA11S]|uniref:GNAT family N-acetyltransferase n=2 Tax=Cyanophyceae TaxID=3028117 RepID=UPI002104A3A7|nr:GNAT family N-acetyltransferase [Synechococcus sp. BSA11S]
MPAFTIQPMSEAHLPLVTEWARQEGFCPGVGDAGVYRHTDAGGLWLGCLGEEPVGCVAGIRYDQRYGFIGLFLVRPAFRGRGYGVALWRHALAHLEGVACIGLEAAPERLIDYSRWGFVAAYDTLRWRLPAASRSRCSGAVLPRGYAVVGRAELAADAGAHDLVLAYDARHEATPRPHFLGEWLGQSNGTVELVRDDLGCCRGFGRIRPCLLSDGAGALGWRLGPLLADAPVLAGALLDRLCSERTGPLMIDAPEANPRAHRLLQERGFQIVGRTVRMYRGRPPALPQQDIYGLACLELG